MRIGDLIKNSSRPFFSLEFFPPSEKSALPAFYDTAKELGALKPLFVSVTYGAGGHKQQNTLDVTSNLAKMGFIVMAHLTCVGASSESITEFVKDLLANGVDNVLALRGDAPKGVDWDWQKGQFHNAAYLVRFIKQNFPQMGIGVAAYPAPHPESATFAEDRRYTAEKLAAGADFAITQLFFDAREYVDLLARLQEANINLPVVPGILPIQSLESLKRVLSLCGANIPGKFYLELEDANAKGGAAAVRETGSVYAIRQIRKLLDAGAPGIHLYTLNKSGLCSRIIRECGLV